MTTDTLVATALVAGITFLILFLRVPAFAVLFSLLVGFVISSEASADVYNFIADLLGFASYQQVQVALLLIPFILTILFLKGSSDRSQSAYDVIPAIFASLMLLLLLYPQVDFIRNTFDSATNGQIENYSSATIIIASLLGLVSVWVSAPKKRHKSKSD